uniref:Ribosomal RNA-processing protein 8 n=1 Tax=Plectus sambesii TaxID=2011161 RepID=A0A914X8M6_9BILA
MAIDDTSHSPTMPVKAKKKKLTQETSEPVVSKNKKNSIPHAPSKTTNDNADDADAKGKRRRPWRDRVRKQAKKQRLQVDRDGTNSHSSSGKTLLEDAVTSSDVIKKKKKRKRPMKFDGVPVKKKDKIDGPVVSTLSSKEESIERLEGARFRYINEQLYTMSGKDAVDFFQQDPEAFQLYHDGYKKQVKKWPGNPLDTIINWLKSKPAGLVVADMGCGEAKLAQSLRDHMTVHSFDLVAVNDQVTACDMVKVPLESGTVDVCVFCLSLMGTNLNEFLREANRILKIGGCLKIAEVTSRFSSVKSFVNALTKMGFALVSKKSPNEFFFVFEFVKEGKVVQKRPLGLKLNPCLYKKR